MEKPAEVSPNLTPTELARWQAAREADKQGSTPEDLERRARIEAILSPEFRRPPHADE